MAAYATRNSYEKRKAIADILDRQARPSSSLPLADLSSCEDEIDKFIATCDMAKFHKDAAAPTQDAADPSSYKDDIDHVIATRATWQSCRTMQPHQRKMPSFQRQWDMQPNKKYNP